MADSRATGPEGSSPTEADRPKNFRPLVTLADAVVIVASLAGYLDRKCDVRPGYERFWRGYSRLQILVEGYDDGQKEAYERGVRDGEEIGYRRAKEESAKTRDALVA